MRKKHKIGINFYKDVRYFNTSDPKRRRQCNRWRTVDGNYVKTGASSQAFSSPASARRNAVVVGESLASYIAGQKVTAAQIAELHNLLHLVEKSASAMAAHGHDYEIVARIRRTLERAGVE